MVRRPGPRFAALHRWILSGPTMALALRSALTLRASARRQRASRATGLMRAFWIAAVLVVLPASAQSPAYESPWSVPPDVAPLSEELRVSLAADLDRGVASRNAGDNAAAVAAFQGLIAPSEASYGPDHPVTATFRFQLGSALAALGRDAEAEPHLRRALATFDRRLGQRANPSVVAQLCSELAELLIRRRDTSGDAVQLAQRTVALRGHDRWFLVQDSWNLGVALLMHNRFEEAARVGAEALQRVEQNFSDPLLLARAQRNYGQLLDGTSHRAEAQTYLQLSITTARDFWNDSTSEVRQQRRAEFANLLPVGFDETPEQLAERARRILSSSADPAAIDPAWRDTVRAFASAELQAGRRKEGHDAYRLLDQLQQRMGDTSLLRNQTLWPAAMALLGDGKEREAVEVLRRVVELDRQGGDFGNSALYRWQLGAAYARAGRRQLAEQTLTDMVAAADATGGPGSAYALTYHNLRAVVLLNAGMPAAAETAARATWRAYQERGSLEISDRATQQSRQWSISDTALLLVSAIWEQEGGGRLSEARAAEVFEAMQDVAASASANAVAAGGARIAAGQEGLGELAAAWLDAQERIASIDQRMLALTAGPEAAARAELLEARRAQERRRAEAEATLRADFGSFFDLLLPSRASLAEARRRLGEDEALILLTPGMPIVNAYATHQGFVLAVTREGAAWARVSIAPAELRTELAALHGQLEAGGATRSPGVGQVQQTLSGALGFDRARAHRLYQALFGAPEVAALVGGKARWTLSVQGMLLSAPFAALVARAPEGGAAGDTDPAALRGTHWLGLERALSVTPSVSAMVAQRRDARTTNRQERIAFFGLGDPAFDGQPGEVRGLEMRTFFNDRSANVGAVRALRRLPATRVEIEQLAAAFGAQRDDYVLDVAATESEVYRRDRDERLGRAEVIAFATHGLIAGDLAQSLAEPALALTPPEQASESDDGLLTASEAARLRLRARWVILSACNTAAGGQPDAEGLSGLARAFLYAGARTLLVSQWRVNDNAAQLLTTRAVELQRAENISTAEAMRRSMEELVADSARDPSGRSFAHPSAWAPFVLVSGE